MNPEDARHGRAAHDSRPGDGCWMCVYSADPIAVQMTNIINDSVHCMSVEAIADQCSACIEGELAKRRIDADSVDGSFAPSALREHIERHMLHANVALVNVLRQLNSLNSALFKQIMSCSEHEGVIDSKQVRDYLAVTAQITSIYKTGDGNRLLFSRSAAAAAAAPGGATGTVTRD